MPQYLHKISEHVFKYCSLKDYKTAGTGTKFGAYVSPLPTLNDNISMAKLSKFKLNTNYITYLPLRSL